MLPKAELHVHLEGTARPELIRRIAARNGVPVPDGLFAGPDRFAWTDFAGFLRAYDLASSVIRTAEDYRDITADYLAGAAAEGAVYVEVIASPDHAAAVGLSDDEHWDGIARGIDDARASHGIEGRILSSCVRNFGVDAAEAVAGRTVEHPHPYLVGFNMGGDEAGYPASDFTAPTRSSPRPASAARSTPASTQARSPFARASRCRASRASATVCARWRTPRWSPSSPRSRSSSRSARPRTSPSGWSPTSSTTRSGAAGGRRRRHARVRRPTVLRCIDRRRVRAGRRAVRPRRRGPARGHGHRAVRELRPAGAPGAALVGGAADRVAR